MLSSSSNKKPVPYELYLLKKNKEPDYLFSMLEKSKKQKQNSQIVENNVLDFKVKQAIRRHMLEKRVNNILTSSSSKLIQKDKITISEPVKFVQKTWIPPIQKQVMSKKFSQEQLIIDAKKKQEKKVNKEKITSILKTFNLNKKMMYFGDFLASQFDNQYRKNPLSICNIPRTKQSKLSFLQGKYKKLMAKNKPKLFIFNSPTQQDKYFFNPLQQDEYFGTIMRTHDRQLMKILITTLSQQTHFSLTSLTKFYDIFVWQCSPKQQLTRFAAKILMGQKQQLPISKISSRIDEICQKINLEQLNQSVENFSEIMKKLLFGEEFVFALKNQYFLTRRALVDSLERNEQCISIFINVFYV